MIYNFTFISLNTTTARLYPQDDMRFGNTLHLTLKTILHANPALGPVYLSKVDLADAYMILWVNMEEVPLVDFLLPNNNPTDPKLFGFHLSLPMGYINSAANFCATTEPTKPIITRVDTHS